MPERLIRFFENQEAQKVEFKEVAEAALSAASPEIVARRHAEVYESLMRE